MKSLIVASLIFLATLQSAQSVHRTTNCVKLKLKFGRVRYRRAGSIARFMCNTGYHLAGEKYSNCINGKWDEVPPVCVRGTCQPVKNIPNSVIHVSHAGGVTHFFCKPDFEIRGAEIVYCDGVRWSSAAPSCLQTATKPAKTCDFEADDLCGWSRDLNHDFDWTRMNRKTPSWSVGTGPSYDHTKGPGRDGYYMYIESSSRTENDTARLVSPIFDRPDAVATCLEFYYHMYGSTTGTLRVYAKTTTPGDDWNSFDPNRAVFDKSGNQGDYWYRAFVDLGRIDADYQIVFEGVRGSGYVSDIAIDDVKITENCNYEDEAVSTTTDFFGSTDQEFVQIVDSCASRCFESETAQNATSPNEITCDCDDFCTERGRCCPDWYDLCIAGITSQSEPDEQPMTSPSEEPDEQPTTQTSKNYDVITKQTTKAVTLATETVAPPTLPRTTRPPVVTTVAATTRGRPVTLTATTMRRPVILTSTTMRRPVITREPPTTRRIFPTKTSKITYVKPAVTASQSDSDDVAYVPRPTAHYVDADVIENVAVRPGDGKPGVIMQKTVKVADDDVPPLRMVGYAFLITVGGFSAFFVPLVLYRRYRRGNAGLCCSNRGVRQSSHGDSQSDVHFLTADEEIDFRWATEDDNDGQ